MWRMSLDWMALMTTFNLTGGALYAMRVSCLSLRIFLHPKEKEWGTDSDVDTGEMVSVPV